MIGFIFMLTLKLAANLNNGPLQWTATNIVNICQILSNFGHFLITILKVRGGASVYDQIPNALFKLNLNFLSLYRFGYRLSFSL